MRSKNRRREAVRYGRSGFSLIELMTTLAIIAILAAVAYPSYQDSVRKARRAEGRAALMQLMQQQERYYSQNNSYIAFSSSSTDAGGKSFKWYSGDSPEHSAYEISGAACQNENIRDCVQLTASPGTSKVNASFKDAVCGKLMLTSTGEKTSSGAGAPGVCWQ